MNAKKLTFFDIFSAILAGVGYGGWAVYINLEAGLSMALLSGAVQAVYAFATTFFITSFARRVFTRFHCRIRGGLTAFILSVIFMVCVPFAVHAAAGTMNIVETIAPGVIWGTIYIAGFLTVLYRKANA